MILNYEEGDVFGPGEVESTGPLMWEPDHVAAGKPVPGPRKPVGKPSKKPRQPVTGTGQQLRDAKFRVPFFGSTTAEEYQFEVEGGQPEIRLNVKSSTSMDFRTPEVGITTETPKARLKPVKVIKREGESQASFLKRAEAFDEVQQFQKKQHRTELAQVRSKVLPKRGLEKYPTAAAQGVTNVLGPLVRTLGSLADPLAPEETWAPQMPALNQSEAGEYGVKVVEGLGSTIPYGITAALTGTTGTALLGASSNGAATYEEAIARGVGHKEALAAAIPGALIGSLEGLMGLGTGRFLGQMGKGTLKGIAKGIGEEEFQELTTQALNNVNAKIVSGYDPQRAMSEGLWETFTTTLGTAGLMHGATTIGPSGSQAKSMPSFIPTELMEMEQRASKAGKPLALTPETRDAYTARNQEIKAQLLAVDPASPEFARLSDEYTGLARAIEDTPATVPQSAEELRQHLIQMNMGHEGAAGEMLDILQPPSSDSDEKSRSQSAVQGARFYPLKGDETKGGTVYLTPQTFEESGLIDKGQRSQVGGLNVPLEVVETAIETLTEKDPAAAVALSGAYQEAQAKGLTQISVLSYIKDQGLSETRKLVRHESFHTGQAAAANEAGVLAIDLHPDEISYHPELLSAAQTKTGQWVLNFYEGDERYLAFELAAYSAAGQNDLFGMTNDQAASYLTDYLTGIADLHGVEALGALAGTARLSSKVQSTVKEIQGNVKQSTQRTKSATDWAAQLRSSASSVPEGLEGSGDSSAGLDAAGAAETGNQDETGGVVGGQAEGEGGGPVGEDSRVGEGGPELYTTVLRPEIIKEYAKKSGDALRQLGLLDPNSLLPPHEQILKVLKEHPELAEPGAIGAALRAKGVSGDETLQQIDETLANAGRTLQAVQAADADWTQVIAEHPHFMAGLAEHGVVTTPGKMAKSAEKEVQTALKDAQASILGRSIWRRSGDLIRKMLLTRFSTAANNAISTLPRIPLDLVDGLMTGTAMGILQPEKWAGKSQATIAEGAKAGALAGMRASVQVATAFPDAARRIFRRAAPAHEFNEMVIAQMEQLHPDLHSKLAGRSTGLDDYNESTVKLDKIRDLLPYLNDGAKFKEYSAKLDMYQKRYDFNHKLAGKLFDKTNWAYDQFLKPGNVQEFFFRRPYFVGALAKHAAAAGFNLSELATNAGTLQNFAADPGGKDAQAIMQLRTLTDLPPQVWEAAADDALTFTYAYNPHRDRGRVEKFVFHYIEFMDALGPIGAVVDAFPKAVFNGMKFAYEYGPVGVIKPLANITDEVYQGGGRKDIQYDDVSRISKALLGTAMFATAIGIRKGLGGEEWWQIKTGKKNKKGEPEYLNVKKYMPFAGFLYMADLALRVTEGRMIDKKPGDDLAELYLGARRADSGGTVFSESIKEMSDYWASGDPLDDTLINKAGKPLGNILGAPLTPFINLRDLIAQFDEDEAARRDVKERPLLGPAIDKLPWLRSGKLGTAGLSLYQPPTELTPRSASAQPALTELGIATDPGSNFATREFSRLGLSPVRWLRPDPDPLINRAQYAAYARKLGAIAPKIEASDRYQAMSDAQKAAFWEAKLSGSDGIASEAKELGERANPQEMNRRELLESQQPLMRKATGLDKKVKEMKNRAGEKPASVPRP